MQQQWSYVARRNDTQTKHWLHGGHFDSAQQGEKMQVGLITRVPVTE